MWNSEYVSWQFFVLWKHEFPEQWFSALFITGLVFLSCMLFIRNHINWHYITSQVAGSQGLQDGCWYSISCSYFLSWPVFNNFCATRYTLFIVLYPVGVTGELLCLYSALPTVAQTKVYSLTMPNAINFTFDLHAALIIFALLYLPGEYKLTYVKLKVHILHIAIALLFV